MLLLRSMLPARGAAQHLAAATRGFAKQAKSKSKTGTKKPKVSLFVPPNSSKKAKKSAAELDLGWEKLKTCLLAIPVELPELKQLEVFTPRAGTGHSGTRIFAREHLPRIRYQNPEAEVSLRADNEGEGWKRSRVVVELQSGERKELDTTDRVEEQVLEQVLVASAASEEGVRRAKEAFTANAGAAVWPPGRRRKRRRPPWFKAWRAVQDEKDALKGAATAELPAAEDAAPAATQASG